MADYLGQVDASATIYIYFTTHAASGAAVAPSTAFEVADVKLYKNGSNVERTSNSGWTMTSPFDSIVGLHCLTIDLSDNTDAGFYSAGARYAAVLSPDETVDSLAVVKVLAYFNIGPLSANVTQLLGTAWATPATAGLTDVNVKQISTDATAADNAEAFFDGTGYAGTNNVIPVVTLTNTVTTLTNKSGFSLVSTGLDLILVDGKTMPVAMQIIGATTAGKLSGAGTGTETFVGLDGSTTRVIATVDSSGNRTAISYP